MQYIVHIISKLGTRIGSKEIDCESDDKAIEYAKQLPGASRLEIWCGGRRVAKIEPPGR
jgi:hypothetical protein